MYNRAEADFVVMLCVHLAGYFGPKKMLNNIGIITPYQRQRRMLTSQLAQRFGFLQYNFNSDSSSVWRPAVHTVILFTIGQLTGHRLYGFVGGSLVDQ